MAVVNPIALATKGVIKEGGNIGPLGLATLGILTVDGGGAPPTPLVLSPRRTQLLSLMGRHRR